MEEIEIASWLTLDALKKEAEIVETVGDLQTGHWQSIFCTIEDDFLELCYLDTESNILKHYEDKEEFEMAIEKRKEEIGETLYPDERPFDAEYEDETEEDMGFPEDEENY